MNLYQTADYVIQKQSLLHGSEILRSDVNFFLGTLWLIAMSTQFETSLFLAEKSSPLASVGLDLTFDTLLV